MCRRAGSPRERGERQSSEGREHRGRDDPAEGGEDRAYGLIAHHPLVARGKHDHDEKWRRRDPVEHRREEERVDGLHSRERDHQADDRRDGDDTIERPGPPPVFVEPLAPTERLGNGVGGRAREHRHREKAGAHHTDCEDDAREVSRERAQSLRGIRAGGDIRGAVRVKGQGRREDDEIHDEVRGEHADGHVDRGDP